MMLKRLQLGFGRGKRPGDAQLSPVGSTVSGSTVRDGAEKKIEKSEQREKNCLDAEAVLLYNHRVATQLN